MTLRYDLKPEYIFEWERKWELNFNTIISPKIKLTYNDLNFEIQNKNIVSFQLLLLKKKYDIIKFDKLHKNWSYELEITENTILKIHINYFNEEDRENVIRRDWEEFIQEKNYVPQ
jgi:hypothetical protein